MTESCRTPVQYKVGYARVPAYLIGHDGRIERRVEMLCADDEAAKDQAKQLVDGHDVELWQRDRRITEFKHRK